MEAKYGKPISSYFLALSLSEKQIYVWLALIKCDRCAWMQLCE